VLAPRFANETQTNPLVTSARLVTEHSSSGWISNSLYFAHLMTCADRVVVAFVRRIGAPLFAVVLMASAGCGNQGNLTAHQSRDIGAISQLQLLIPFRGYL
jgi:hypothetical protein